MITPPFRVIVAGSRDVTSLEMVEAAVQSSTFVNRLTEIVSGGARGVDQLGEHWARSRGVPVRQFLADWNRYPRTAGRLRNNEMAEYADALVAIWDGHSRGTKHMIEAMLARSKPTYIRRVKL
jgi:hypothetical protein